MLFNWLDKRAELNNWSSLASAGVGFIIHFKFLARLG
jgi:hypothetical protein